MTTGSRIKYQLLGVIYVNIMAISFGTFIGWPSASFLELLAEDSPLEMGPMTKTEAGLVSATLSLGGFFGTILFTLLADRLGQKKCLMLLTIPNFIGWIVNYYAQNPFQLCVSRLFAGFLGSIYVIIPIYVTEISDVRVRGIFGSFMIQSLNLGVLIAFICGNFVSFANTAVICIPIPIIFLIAYLGFPETPQYYINRQNVEKAEQSLRFYRNIKDIKEDLPKEHVAELSKLQMQASRVKYVHASWHDFNNRTARKAMIIGIVLVLLSQLAGASTLLNFSGGIIAESCPTLSPTVSAIILGTIQLIGSCLSASLVENAGRKILITISAIGTGLGHICLGVYFYLDTHEYDTTAFHWVPITTLSFTLFIECVGVTTLPFLLIAEIMPLKIRNIGTMLCISLIWIVGFISSLCFPILMDAIGLHGTLFLFACFCFLGAAFIIIFVPETKGKTLEDVLLLL